MLTILYLLLGAWLLLGLCAVAACVAGGRSEQRSCAPEGGIQHLPANACAAHDHIPEAAAALGD